MMKPDAAPVLAVGEPARDRKRPRAVRAGRYLGRLPEGSEASMATVSPPESRSAALPVPRDPSVVARPGPTPAVQTRAAIPTPLFTRHTLGTIEAERDRRGVFRATHRRRLPGRAAMAHPRLAAARASEARRMTEARVAYSRWADEGGKSDPGAAARLRIGDRKMKRCNSSAPRA
jgi:hypothetical protein